MEEENFPRGGQFYIFTVFSYLSWCNKNVDLRTMNIYPIKGRDYNYSPVNLSLKWQNNIYGHLL
jgi:hypothetical protein